MMRAFLLIVGVFLAFSTRAQDVPLTFRVDMSNEEISENGVHVAGTFQMEAGYPSNWDPGTAELSDPDGDMVYELTVEVSPGNYLYKYINGSSWAEQPEDPPGFCALNDGGGNMNRQVAVGSEGIVLPVVVFDSCNAVIRFSVNLLAEEVSDDGVFVTGDFLEPAGYPENWLESGLELSDQNGNATYELMVEVPAGNYSFLFSNGSAQEDFEGDCLNPSGYRTTSATTGGPPMPTVCFNSCEVCDPNLTEDYPLHWWNDATFYEIFIRSFYDSDGDGIGDFQGIIEKLDYLNDGDPETTDDLGITGIWLMPSMPSPSYHGYDVTDYYGIEPDYGTMDDFLEFLDEAHARGIRVIIDYVMNHTSSQHPWFNQSTANTNGFRDWYVWSNTNPGFDGPWGQTVWHWANGDWYYGLFWGGMPDLNYDHLPVKEEMMEIAQYWIDLGADGFRLDAIKYLDEDGTVLENTPETFAILEELNDVVNDADEDAVLVGEVWSPTSSVAPYVSDELLNVCFEFSLAEAILSAVNEGNSSNIYSQMASLQSYYPKLQYATFLTNHDINRVFDQFGNDESKMKLGAAIYLTLPGVPFIYYGEEVGMEGSGPDEIKRRPMQWTNGMNAGFTNGSPWIELGDNYETNNVETMESDPNSLLHFYRDFVRFRNELAPLRRGYFLPLYGDDPEILHYIRIYENEAIAVVMNMGDEPKSTALDLPISTLSSATYVVTEMTQEIILPDLEVNGVGGFDQWQPFEELAPGEVRVYAIGSDSPLSSEGNEEFISEVLLYPNPAKDLIFLQSAAADFSGNYHIFDSSGRLLQSGPARGKAFTVDLSALNGGIYFVQVETAEGVIVKRVVLD
jgi:glycosidase